MAPELKLTDLFLYLIEGVTDLAPLLEQFLKTPVFRGEVLHVPGFFPNQVAEDFLCLAEQMRLCGSLSQAFCLTMEAKGGDRADDAVTKGGHAGVMKVEEV